MFRLCIFGLLGMLASCASSDITKIAHRGASGYLPEHTLEGTVLAHSWNIDYIEPDLVLTKDNVLIVLHDHHLDTTTNVADKFPRRKRKDGRFYAIDFTLAEIKTLSVYERFNYKTGEKVFENRFKGRVRGFQVPTFEEFTTLVSELNRSRLKDIGIYPELKQPEFHLKEGKDITAYFVKTLEKNKVEKVIIQSFWPNTLKRLKEEFKRREFLVQLVGKNSWGESSADYDEMLTDSGLKNVASYADGIGVSFGHVLEDPSLVKRAKTQNLKVHVYTHRLDQLYGEHTAQKALEYVKSLGVDGVFSDFADQL